MRDPPVALLSSVQVIDLTRDFEDGLQRLERKLKAAGIDPSDTFHWDGSRPPYPGLPAFDEEHAAAFFVAKMRSSKGPMRCAVSTVSVRHNLSCSLALLEVASRY
jgi:hypothetical protein